MITVFKLVSYWKSIFSFCFPLKYTFIICYEKLKDAHILRGSYIGYAPVVQAHEIVPLSR